MRIRYFALLALLIAFATNSYASERIVVDDSTGEFSLASYGSEGGCQTACGCQEETTCGCNTCDDGCCDSCKGKLLGFIAPTDTTYSSFISPMTNPVFFEDPRTLTEARIIFVHHTVPTRAPLTGGHVNLIAAQLRAALTDRLSIIATKDGFFTFDGGVANLLGGPATDGWADVAAGLKYNLFSDPCCQRLLSAGATFELPVGSTRALQGNGSGEFNLFLTGGTQVGDRSHLVSAAGWRLPTDRVEESQVTYWSTHFDTQLPDTCLYVFGETNWYHWVNSGGGLPLNIEGLDVFNLGTSDVAGNDIVTGAIGLKFKPSVLNEIGVAWEAPLTDRRDVLDNRLTVDWIIRY